MRAAAPLHALFLSLLLSPLLAPEARATEPAPAAPCAEAVRSRRFAEDSSVPAGLLRHGEHWTDLLITQAGTSEPRPFEAFADIARQLARAAEAGVMKEVNEKVDGSPAIVLGFTAEGKPFVTYKEDLDPTKARQRLVTDPAAVPELFQNPDLARAYEALARLLLPRLARLRTPGKEDYLFQADLLFTPGAAPGRGKWQEPDGTVKIRANTLTYSIAPDRPEFAAARDAQVGLVIHTVARRDWVRADENGPIDPPRITYAAAPESERGRVLEVVEALNGAEVLALHPWTRDVPIAREAPAPPGLSEEVDRRLARVADLLAGVSPEARELWKTAHKAPFKIWFNSQVRPPNDGGFYKAAREQAPFDAARWLADYRRWAEDRTVLRERKGRNGKLRKSRLLPVRYLADWDALVAERGPELARILEACYDAARIQYLLLPHFAEMMRSKLGGGDVEGVMLEAPGALVKLVDRLGFTLQNNLNWNRGEEDGEEGGASAADAPATDAPAPAAVAAPAPAEAPTALSARAPEVAATEAPQTHQGFEAPLDRWRAGDAFLVMKGQPVHGGHIEMARLALRSNPDGEVWILPSDKEPNLAATRWKDLKLTKNNTLKELKRRDYVYLFDRDLRRRIFEAALGEDAARVKFSNTYAFWGYVKHGAEAGEQGRVKFVLGRKDLDEGTYAQQFIEYAPWLEPMVIPPQHGGVSGTEVRLELCRAAIGDEPTRAAARTRLDHAYAVIADASVRARLIDEMVARWLEVDQVVQKLVGAPLEGCPEPEPGNASEAEAS